MEDENLKICHKKISTFIKFKKSTKNIVKSTNFLVYKEKMYPDKATLKINKK